MRLLGIIIIASLAWACNGPKKAMEVDESAQSAVDTVVMVVEQPDADSLIISLRRTPCFGRCPVYKINVYKSGFATYEGINFAEKLGLYSFQFSDEDIESIYQSALAIDYFDLESEYDDPMVSDLPGTYSRIHLHDKDHTVKARMNIPEKLKIFHTNLSVTLMEKNWQPYSER